MKKFMNKITAIIIAITLVFASVAFGGCSNERHVCACADGLSMPTIERELEVTIRQYFINNYIIPNPLISDTTRPHLIYFGTYRGASVIEIGPWVNIAQRVRFWYEAVAGVTFYFTIPTAPLDIWYNGSFYSLTEAYEKGLLTAREIKCIYRLFTHYRHVMGAMCPIIASAIIESPDFSRGIWRYYGTFDGATVINRSIGMSIGLWSETIAGYTFGYGMHLAIEVWYNGNFYHLTQAYEKGILTLEGVRGAHFRWRFFVMRGEVYMLINEPTYRIDRASRFRTLQEREFWLEYLGNFPELLQMWETALKTDYELRLWWNDPLKNHPWITQRTS